MVELILGIIIGLLLTISSFWIFRVKCPECKKLKPLKETLVLSWKSRIITTQPCQDCQEENREIEIF